MAIGDEGDAFLQPKTKRIKARVVENTNPQPRGGLTIVDDEENPDKYDPDYIAKCKSCLERKNTVYCSEVKRLKRLILEDTNPVVRSYYYERRCDLKYWREQYRNHRVSLIPQNLLQRDNLVLRLKNRLDQSGFIYPVINCMSMAKLGQWAKYDQHAGFQTNTE